jgi:LysM repeat protein
MKILQIFGAVVAIHLLAFIFIFASPGCQSSPRNVPTPDATMPTASAPSADASVSYTPGAAPADLGTASTTPPLVPGHAAPTRPGSPNAAAVMPAKPVVDDVAPVSTYTVQKGDSLWSIAKKNHLTVSELAKANSLGAGTALQPGQKLIIPGKAGVAAAKDLSAAPSAVSAAPETHAAAPARASGEAVKHVVQPGEKLGTIARKYQVSVGELASANGITDPAKVRVGQTLVIPGFKAVNGKSSGKAAKAPAKAATDTAAAETAAPAKDTTPHFEIKAPPPGQDLDAGLKDNAGTEVPTIKVDETPKPEEPPKK